MSAGGCCQVCVCRVRGHRWSASHRQVLDWCELGTELPHEHAPRSRGPKTGLTKRVPNFQTCARQLYNTQLGNLLDTTSM